MQLTPEKIEAARRAMRRFGYQGFAFDRERGTMFYIVSALGAGSTATTFSATSALGNPPAWALKDFWSASERPVGTEELVVPESSHDEPFDAQLVWQIESEARLCRIIRERLPAEFCDTRIVCAVSYFYNAERTRGTIVFPLVDSISLDSWLVSEHCQPARSFKVMHAGVDFFELLVRRANILRNLADQQALVDSGGAVESPSRAPFIDDDDPPYEYNDVAERRLLQGIRDLLAEFDGNYVDAMRDYVLFQTRMMLLSGALLYTVEQLHAKRIFHGDIKPDNILVERISAREIVPHLRLIDFGGGCTTAIESDADLPALCLSGMTTTVTFRDPLSVRRIPSGTSVEMVERIKAGFDDYSLAKVIGLLFDPDRCIENVESYQMARFSRTAYMPPGLYALLRDMVGNDNDTQYQGGGPEVIDDADYMQRALTFDARPTTSEALARFNQIFHKWHELTDAAFNQ